MTIAFIGVPLNYGCGKKTISISPDLVRDAGIPKKWRHGELIDCGDIPIDPLTGADILDRRLNFLRPVAHANALLSRKVEEVIKTGHDPLCLGGDHAIAIGSLAGVLSTGERTAVIWIDAHTDINTKNTSPTGNIHGMPISYAVGMNREDFSSVYTHDYRLAYEDLYYIGPRNVDPPEKDEVHKHHICCYSTEDIRQQSIVSIASTIIETIQTSGVKRVHLSLDIDCLDPCYAPGVSTPVPNGMKKSDLRELLIALFQDLPIGSVDIVEFHPDADVEHTTLNTVMEILELMAEHWQSSAK